MRIISWNIQWGRGADGRVDLDRTIAAIHAMGGAEVICLQEVTRGFPELTGDPDDSVARLSAAFPGHEAVFGPAVDVPASRMGRACFGNLLLSAVPVGQVFRHALPFPADPTVPGMPRACIEAVLHPPHGPIRLLTTHLEYYSARQRQAQIAALRALQAEAAGHVGTPKGKDSNPAFAARPRPARAVLCGDFNMTPESPEYAVMASAPDVLGAGWLDAWRVVHPERRHDDTVGLHGAEWPDHACCCDYFWVSGDLAQKVVRVAVDSTTPASDHQPVLLVLGE